MKRILLVFAATMLALAGTATTIYVNGTKITGTTTFTTGGGTVSYNASTKVLNVTDVQFARTGSDNNAIDNQDVDGLTINFSGKCYFKIWNADVFNLKANTTINVLDGKTQLECYASDQNPIKARGADVTIKGAGHLYLVSMAGPSIEGKNGTETVTMQIARVTSVAYNSDFYNLKKLDIKAYTSDGSKNTFLLFRYSLRDKGGYTHLRNVGSYSIDSRLIMQAPGPNVSTATALTSSNYELTTLVFGDKNYIYYPSEYYFPDANFRTAVATYDTDEDQFLSTKEIGAVTSMNVDSKSIANLKGVELFTSLTSLSCNFNKLTSLDLRKLTKLKTVYCDGNQLMSLNVSGLSSLQTLMCQRNKLTAIGISGNSSLTALNVAENNIGSEAMASLISALPKYSTAKGTLTARNDGSNNTEKNIITVSQVNSAAQKGWAVMHWLEYGKEIDAFAGLLPIDWTTFPDTNFRNIIQTYDKDKDGYLNPDEVAAIKTLDVRDKGITGTLTGVGYLTSLETLDCSYNKLTSLNLYDCAALTELYCNDNELKSLTLPKTVAGKVNPLKILQCSNNKIYGPLDLHPEYAKLQTVDVSNNDLRYIKLYDSMTELSVLKCGGGSNYLGGLDVSMLPRLMYLECENAGVTQLLVSPDNTSLRSVTAHNNLIALLDMKNLIDNLPDYPPYSDTGILDIKGITDSDRDIYEANVITVSMVQKARSKGWRVRGINSDGYFDDYKGDITPDLNGDKVVNTGDVSKLYDVVLGNETNPLYIERAKINDDDVVNTGDVSILYQIILGEEQ